MLVRSCGLHRRVGQGVTQGFWYQLSYERFQGILLTKASNETTAKKRYISQRIEHIYIVTMED